MTSNGPWIGEHNTQWLAELFNQQSIMQFGKRMKRHVSIARNMLYGLANLWQQNNDVAVLEVLHLEYSVPVRVQNGPNPGQTVLRCKG